MADEKTSTRSSKSKGLSFWNLNVCFYKKPKFSSAKACILKTCQPALSACIPLCLFPCWCCSLRIWHRPRSVDSKQFLRRKQPPFPVDLLFRSRNFEKGILEYNETKQHASIRLYLKYAWKLFFRQTINVFSQTLNFLDCPEVGQEVLDFLALNFYKHILLFDVSVHISL